MALVAHISVIATQPDMVVRYMQGSNPVRPTRVTRHIREAGGRFPHSHVVRMRVYMRAPLFYIHAARIHTEDTRLRRAQL